MRIALISCTKTKQDTKCIAKDMYMKSTLFSKTLRYVLSKDYNDWYILSAKYGLLDKNKIIEPYDKTLYKMKKSEIIQWSNNVFIEIMNLEVDEIDFYAGKKYREYLIHLLENNGIKCNVPLEGLGIGEQLAFYNKMNLKKMRI